MDKRKMYLMKRPENGVWYFRRPIPKELQPFVQSGNKQTITMSLKTKKLNEARQLHHEHWMESERVLAEARATAKAGGVANGGMAGKKATARALVTKRPLREFSKPELQGLVQRWYLRAMGDALERSRSMFNFGEPEERKRALAELDSELASLERREGAVLDVWTTPTKRAIIEAAGGYITAGHPGAFMETNMWFTAIVREALIRLNRYSFGIQQTGTPPSLEDSTPELSSSALVRVSNAAPSITLDELLEKFDKDPDRAHIKPKTRDEYRLVYAMLREAVGGSTPLASITREQIKGLQDVYRSLPAHFARLYPKKTLRQAAEQAKQDGRPPMERATFNKRMTLLSGVFLYAEKEQLMSSSPAKGLTMREKRKAEGEKSFSVNQLNRIFGGTVFQDFAKDPRAHITPSHPLRPHEFWAPIIALFQGFRMEEILQLRPDDIAEQDGVTCIHIRDGEGQSVKTEASRRIVPLHPLLARLGFPRFAEAARQAGLEDLFPEAKRGQTYGNRSHNYSKRFSRYLVEVEVKEGRNQTFHSLRHTFADGLRLAEVPQDARRRLGGWTDPTSLEASYGGRLLPYLAEHLAKLKYEGLDLSHVLSSGPRRRPRSRL